jgi:phosphoglycolate phosphatase
LYPGVEKTLHILQEKGIAMAIVSGAPTKALEDIKRLYLRSYFKEICLDTKQKKEKILEVLERCKIPPHRAFYLTDTPEGIEAGRDAGVITMGFIEGYGSPDEIRAAQPDHVISSLEMLTAIHRVPVRKIHNP